MPAPVRLYTVDDVRAIPDDLNRYETIAGELLVTPAPGTPHQTVLRTLFVTLWDYVRAHDLGQVWFAPVDVVFGSLTLVEPDLLFVAGGRIGIVTEREITAAPDLAVEVISPSTARTDRGHKRALYQETGVREYWIVDIARRHIEVWRPGALTAEIHDDALDWQPAPSVAALTIDVPRLFVDLPGAAGA